VLGKTPKKQRKANDGKRTVDAAMGTVSPPAHLRRPVHLNMVDDETIDFQPLVERIRFGILQQLEEEFGGLFGPSSLSRLPGLGLRAPANSSVETPEGDAFLLGDDVLQKLDGTTKRHLFDDLGRFSSVLAYESIRYISETIEFAVPEIKIQ
jgi:hypothetical protein